MGKITKAQYNKSKSFLIGKLPSRTRVKMATEKQLSEWEKFKQERTVKLTDAQIKFVCELYGDLFMVPVYYPVVGNIKPLIVMIDRLDLVWDSYQKK